ncbi:MAG: biosynthetic-type acetolactate synthase large subunit [Chloroflexi bacterium]|nr:MAG: biosynthetic-type acetolactate synthase large subunit [Chloroflexota bacterium]
MRRTGAQIVWECLKREGVEVVFGYPGGAILPTYDAMTQYDFVHHVLTRHEQGATHMADGYARATGKVGVAMATSGPGATNMVTGIATAMMDSSPIVCITGQVPTTALGGDAFQETDVTGVTLPITKHNYLVTDVNDLAYIIPEAFYIARTGRPGPVLIDICKDVQIAETEFRYPEEPLSLPGYVPPSEAAPEEVQQAAELINEAKRPLVLAGHGVLMSGAMRELLEFAERGSVPVAQTLLGIGNMPASHPLNLGMMGMHGEAYVNQAIQAADLLLAFGMRFDDRVTGNLATYAPNSKKIHIEIDPSEINKNVPVDIGIVGDLKTVLQQLNPLVEKRDRSAWLRQIDEWKADTRARDIIHQDSNGRLLGAHVIHDIWKATEGDAIVVTGVGQHQMWAAQYYRLERPFTLITSGGLGTMGFGLPAGIGAKMGRPDKEVWVIEGDGGFQMTAAELATAVQENVDINIAIINNFYLGMVRQWQELFYEERYHATPLVNPDFVKLADAHGIPAVRVERREEVIPAVQRARETPGPFLIDFKVEPADIVYPMVPAGADLDKMIRRPLPERIASLQAEWTPQPQSGRELQET